MKGERINRIKFLVFNTGWIIKTRSEVHRFDSGLQLDEGGTPRTP